jgi:hypothetical protein
MAKRSYRNLFEFLESGYSYSESRGSVWKFGGLRLDFAERQGLGCKMLGKMRWTRFMAHEPVEALAHGGLKTEEAVVAHRSSCSRPVWATMARRDRGK